MYEFPFVLQRRDSKELVPSRRATRLLGDTGMESVQAKTGDRSVLRATEPTALSPALPTQAKMYEAPVRESEVRLREKPKAPKGDC